MADDKDQGMADSSSGLSSEPSYTSTSCSSPAASSTDTSANGLSFDKHEWYDQGWSDHSFEEDAMKCICGACADGFLSPRMRWKLQNFASLFCDLLPLSLDPFHDRNHGASSCDDESLDPDVAGEPESNDLMHLQPQLRYQMRRDQRLRLGYSRLFGLISRCLRSEKVPWPSIVNQMVLGWSLEQNFLEHQGTVQHALNYLLTTSEDIEKAYSTAVNELKMLTEPEFRRLPRCVNDNNYKLVKENLFSVGQD